MIIPTSFAPVNPKAHGGGEGDREVQGQRRPAQHGAPGRTCSSSRSVIESEKVLAKPDTLQADRAQDPRRAGEADRRPRACSATTKRTPTARR